MPANDDPMRPIERAWAESAPAGRDDDGRDEFEARVVRYIVGRCGMPSAADYLTRRATELTGDPTISFVLFNHLVAGFPVRLGVARLYHLEENLTLDGLFRRPGKSPIYRAFRQWAEEDVTDDDRYRGIIFRLPGCPGNGSRAILHTYPVPVEGQQTRVTFGVEERRVVTLYTLEPLDQLLDTLIRTYRPDAYS